MLEGGSGEGFRGKGVLRAFDGGLCKQHGVDQGRGTSRVPFFFSGFPKKKPVRKMQPRVGRWHDMVFTSVREDTLPATPGAVDLKGGGNRRAPAPGGRPRLGWDWAGGARVGGLKGRVMGHRGMVHYTPPIALDFPGLAKSSPCPGVVDGTRSIHSDFQKRGESPVHPGGANRDAGAGGDVAKFVARAQFGRPANNGNQCSPIGSTFEVLTKDLDLQWLGTIDRFVHRARDRGGQVWCVGGKTKSGNSIPTPVEIPPGAAWSGEGDNWLRILTFRRGDPKMGLGNNNFSCGFPVGTTPHVGGPRGQGGQRLVWRWKSGRWRWRALRGPTGFFRWPFTPKQGGGHVQCFGIGDGWQQVLFAGLRVGPHQSPAGATWPPKKKKMLGGATFHRRKSAWAPVQGGRGEESAQQTRVLFGGNKQVVMSFENVFWLRGGNAGRGECLGIRLGGKRRFPPMGGGGPYLDGGGKSLGVDSQMW